MIERQIREIYEEVNKEDYRGELADYIPELAKADIQDLGLALIGRDKKIYSIGSLDRRFTIQSVSKVLALALALEDRGLDFLRDKVSFKGSSKAFNSFSDLEDHILPANPMINSGALVTSSWIEGSSIDRILELVREMTSNPSIDYNRQVYLSEKATGDRNKALAYILKGNELLGGPLDQVLDSYFKQCSIELGVEDLARLAYVFAFKGYNLEGKKIFKEETIRLVNALMLTCGMYDNSGEYAMEVGIPSKSGVAGSILAAAPNKAGIGVYSPGLDGAGNSLLGVRALESISKNLNYNIF